MDRLLELLLLTLLVKACVICGELLIPPVQTQAQLKAFTRIAMSALNASNDAERGTIAFIGSEAVQSALGRIAPELTALKPEELWNRYKKQVEVTEILHGFPAANNPTQNNALDLDIDIALNASWFYNQWQLPILYRAREFTSYWSLIAYLAPAAATEVGTWKLNAFTGDIPGPTNTRGMWPGGYPASLPEASDRAVYAVFNQHRLDFPVRLWGNVGFVFRNEYVKNLTILMPVDTGDVTCGCNTTFTRDFCKTWTNESACKKFWYCHWVNGTTTEPYAPNGGLCRGGEKADGGATVHNCSLDATGGTVYLNGTWPAGTMDHHAHLLQKYGNWYGSSIAGDRVAELLARMVLPWETAPNVTHRHFDYYYEADMLGNPRIPDSVKFIVASVPELFGTDLGDKVKTLCRKWGWALIWSRSTRANPETSISITSKNRILDPTVEPQATNASGVGAHSTAFTDAWAKAVRARAAGDMWVITTLWDSLCAAVEQDLWVQPLRADACDNVAQCIGTDQQNRCICYV
eukprot:m.298601 g.298601  ORF g.298601 m.298601 type:complete len:520 (+) comp20092_c0_seq2:141-1700(+)